MVRSHHSLISALLFALLMTAGCGPAFPRETLDRLNRNISFAELKKDPERFKGAWVMLGGTIIATRNTREGTLMEILQQPLDTGGKPLETDLTEGRFLVQTDVFLDSAVYHRGRMITVVAEVIGRKDLPLDEIIYPYPLLGVKELQLWGSSTGPRFIFGIGVSHEL